MVIIDNTGTVSQTAIPRCGHSPSCAMCISTVSAFLVGAEGVTGGVRLLGRGPGPERALYSGTALAMATALASTSRLRQTSWKRFYLL